MLLLDILVFIIAILFLFVIISKITLTKRQYLILIGAFTIVTILHLIFGDMRWQLYLLYLAIVIEELYIGIHVFNLQIRYRYVKRVILMVDVLFIVLATSLVFAFPRYTLPTPNGEHLIGTEVFTIENEDYIELYSGETENRRFVIQVWYPAETIDGYEQVPWLYDGKILSRALSKDNYLPSFALDHAVNIKSNAYYNAPISTEETSYPVVIISHGWRGFRNLHTDFAEELASMGYIVVAIDHTYGSVATVFEDGEVAYLNLDALPPRNTTDNFLENANLLVKSYASDVSKTLDYLEELNNNLVPSKYAGKLDLTNIGHLGHSTGGGAGVAVVLEDNRIDSIVGLDAWVEPIGQTDLSNGLSIPSLFLRSGNWETGENNAYLINLIDSSSFEPEFYQIDGTTHYDFAMVYMYSPLTKTIGFTGTVDSGYLTSILKSMIVDFFNETLKDDPLSDINPDYWDEVHIIE